MTPALINLISCAFALLAAGFWLWSAATRFPELRGRHKTVLEDMQLRSQTLRHQSRPQRGRRGFRRRCSSNQSVSSRRSRAEGARTPEQCDDRTSLDAACDAYVST
jgi:hypothetical protein